MSCQDIAMLFGKLLIKLIVAVVVYDDFATDIANQVMMVVIRTLKFETGNALGIDRFEEEACIGEYFNVSVDRGTIDL